MSDERGVVGDEARQLLSEAYRARRAAIRTRAVLSLFFSTLGIGFTVLYFGAQLLRGVIVIGGESLIVAALGIFSVAWFFKGLFRLLTGNTSGPVD